MGNVAGVFRPPAAGKHSTGSLVGLTQHTPHARLPGTCPATQESEATVWTSEHRHESAGDRQKGFTSDCASYQILAELGSLAREKQQHLTGDPKEPCKASHEVTGSRRGLTSISCQVSSIFQCWSHLGSQEAWGQFYHQHCHHSWVV